jgi:hypothetical protein
MSHLDLSLAALLFLGISFFFSFLSIPICRCCSSTFHLLSRKGRGEWTYRHADKYEELYCIKHEKHAKDWEKADTRMRKGKKALTDSFSLIFSIFLHSIASFSSPSIHHYHHLTMAQNEPIHHCSDFLLPLHIPIPSLFSLFSTPSISIKVLLLLLPNSVDLPLLSGCNVQFYDG